MKKYLLILVTLILTFPLDIIAQEETINVTGIVRIVRRTPCGS